MPHIYPVDEEYSCSRDSVASIFIVYFPPARHSWTCARSLFGARASPHPHLTRTHFTLLRTFSLLPSLFFFFLSTFFSLLHPPCFLLSASRSSVFLFQYTNWVFHRSNASSATYHPKCLRRRPPPARPSLESRERRRVRIFRRFLSFLILVILANLSQTPTRPSVVSRHTCSSPTTTGKRSARRTLVSRSVRLTVASTLRQ